MNPQMEICQIVTLFGLFLIRKKEEGSVMAGQDERPSTKPLFASCFKPNWKMLVGIWIFCSHICGDKIGC